MGLDAMILVFWMLVFWMLSFKPTFSFSSSTFIKRLFSSSSLSAVRVVSSAYLRLLIFLPAILILACASFSPTFHMMYSEYKLKKQGDNIQPWHSSFPIWNQSVVPCTVLFIYPLFPICQLNAEDCESLRMVKPQKRKRAGFLTSPEMESYSWTVLSCSVMSNSMLPHGLQPTRLLSPWGFSR